MKTRKPSRQIKLSTTQMTALTAAFAAKRHADDTLHQILMEIGLAEGDDYSVLSDGTMVITTPRRPQKFA